MEDTTAAREVASRFASSRASPILEITYFTDPLCCWSWGFEPQLRRLRYGFAGRIAWRTCLVGMIADWDSFSDPLNDIHRPVQMGPLWVQAATVTGMPSKPDVWVGDPPSSSWPSCLAVRAAGLQSPQAADLYLRLVRRAAMAEGRNVAREDVLLHLARELGARCPELFDADRLARELASPAARAALEDDVRETRFRRVGRFPCLRLRRPGADPAWLLGWRPVKPLLDALYEFAPAIGRERRPSSPAAYEAYWGEVTARETAVAIEPVAEANLQVQGLDPDSCSSSSQSYPAE